MDHDFHDTTQLGTKRAIDGRCIAWYRRIAYEGRKRLAFLLALLVCIDEAEVRYPSSMICIMNTSKLLNSLYLTCQSFDLAVVYLINAELHTRHSRTWSRDCHNQHEHLLLASLSTSWLLDSELPTTPMLFLSCDTALARF